MHDIKAIRENPQAFVQGWSRRGRETAQSDVDALLALDADLRAAQTAFQAAQSRRNDASKQIGQAKAQKDEAKAQALMAEVAELKTTIETTQESERLKGEELRNLLASLPNIPFEDVPEGADEHGNVEVRKHGAPNILSFPAKDHADLGETLKMMDFEAAAKMSGSRFVVLKGQLARLERAIGQFMLDVQTTEHGYTEVNPPVLVRGDALFGTGQLPKFEEDLFKTVSFNHDDYEVDLAKINLDEMLSGKLNDGEWEAAKIAYSKLRHSNNYLNDIRYLIPTAEVTLTNLVREAITAEEDLPLRLTALTNCFRAEAGSAGRDTKGMIRQHQFQKVELVSITTPEQSAAEHERMTNCAETILKKLDLSFRTMLLCTGDMGFGAKKTYDLEVWLPSQNTYREISSCSNCGDFQARRMDAKFKRSQAKSLSHIGRDETGRPLNFGTGHMGKISKNEFVHTLNGSGLAVGRTLVAIMENYQDEGGRIAIPAVLQPYMGGLTHIG